MNDDPRYASGTSLERTKKEMLLDSIVEKIGDMSDELYIAMKKIPTEQLNELYLLLKRG